MKRSLLAMGLTLGLCPLWGMAQGAPGETWTNVDAMENRGEGGMQPWVADAELSPNAVPSPDWVNVLGIDFRGLNSGFNVGTWLHGALVCQAGSTNQYASARLHIPHKRKITHFRLWGYDNNPTANLNARLWESCLPDVGSATSPTIKQLGLLTSAGTPAAFTIVTGLNPAPEVDAHLCTYWAVVNFDECSSSINLQVAKIHVEHKK